MAFSSNGMRRATASAILLSACAYGGAALAHDEPRHKHREVERVIVIDDKDGDWPGVRVRRGAGEKERVIIIDRRGPGAHHRQRVRRFHIDRDGHEGRKLRIERDGRSVRTFHIDRDARGAHFAGCRGERSEVDESSDNGSERTRVIICGREGVSVAQRAEKLEQALARINANEHLSGESKARVSEALREALEQVRGTTP